MCDGNVNRRHECHFALERAAGDHWKQDRGARLGREPSTPKKISKERSMRFVFGLLRCSHRSPGGAGPDTSRHAGRICSRNRAAALGPARWIETAPAYTTGRNRLRWGCVRLVRSRPPRCAASTFGAPLGPRRRERGAGLRRLAWSADGNLLCVTKPHASGGRIRAATTGCSPQDRRAAKACGPNAPAVHAHVCQVFAHRRSRAYVRQGNVTWSGFGWPSRP